MTVVSTVVSAMSQTRMPSHLLDALASDAIRPAHVVVVLAEVCVPQAPVTLADLV